MLKTRGKKLLCMLLAAAMIVPFAACANGSSNSSGASQGKDGSPVTLTFWAGSETEDRNAFLKDTFEKFHQKNPNITVDYLGVPGSASDLDQKLNMAIAGGEVPDVVAGFLTSSYISRKVVEPLDSYLDKSSVKDDIDPKYFDVFRNADVKNKKLYAIPGPTGVAMIFLRPDLIKAAGLSPNMNNWNDFFTIADKTTQANKGIYGYIIRGGSAGAAAIEMMMYSYSGITSFFDKNGKCTINDPKNVEFVEKYLSRFRKDTSADDLNKNWTAMAAQFQSGKAVMLSHNTGSGPANFKAFNNDQNKVEGIAFPKSPYTSKVTVPQPMLNGYMIMADSKHKTEGWKLIEFLQTPENSGGYAKVQGSLPVTKSAQKQDWIQNTEYMKAASDSSNNPNTVFINYPYYLPNFTKIETNEDLQVQAVLLGKITAKKMLDDWAQKLQAEYNNFKNS